MCAAEHSSHAEAERFIPGPREDALTRDLGDVVLAVSSGGLFGRRWRGYMSQALIERSIGLAITPCR
jgi:hypothetical protein